MMEAIASLAGARTEQPLPLPSQKITDLAISTSAGLLGTHTIQLDVTVRNMAPDTLTVGGSPSPLAHVQRATRQKMAKYDVEVRAQGDSFVPVAISVYGPMDLDAVEPLLDTLKSGMANRWRLNEGMAGHWIRQWLGVAAIKGALQASTRWLSLHFGTGAVQQLGGWPARPPH
jgi:hypothetical protein